MRPSQVAAFQDLRDELLAILNGPTGWGKSLVVVAMLVSHLLNDLRRKVIVVIPQCVIAKGFVGTVDLQLPSGQIVPWRVTNNLCERSQNKVDQLRHFIVSPASKDLADRVVVTTNMGFAYAYASLEPEQLTTVFQHTTIVFDEAHHIQASDAGFNNLGEAVNLLLNLNDPTIRIILSTAYFFRGDRLPIIPENHLDRFVRHHIPFDEHWAQLRHLESYSYDFVAYKGTVWTELEAILAQSQEPTIIFCPPDGHRLYLGRQKKRFIRRVVSLLRKYYPDAMVWHPDHDNKAKRKIVNLADPHDRARKVQFAMRNGDKIAAIVTVGMFKEGADWVQASRVIDLVPTGSDQDRNQRFGRLIRDCPGKQHVSYLSFFPHITDEDKGKQREQLTKLFAHFHASLVLENALNPLRIPVAKREGEQDQPHHRQSVNFLGEYDVPTQEAVIRDCCEELVALADDKARDGQSVLPEEARQAIRRVLREHHGITEHQDELAKQIMLILRRRQNVHLPCEKLVRAGFDKVWHIEALDGIVMFSGGVGGPKTFQEIRQSIQTVFEEQWMETYGQIKAMPCAPDSQSSAYWWCSHNKVLHKQGKLSAEKVHLLENLAWWSWADSFPNRWMNQYERISHLASCPQSGTQCYDWVRTQRRLYRAGRLPQDRITACESIPWWSWASNDGNWDAVYQQVRQLSGQPLAGTKEYDWAKHQRNMRIKGRLPADRIKLLEDISWWSWRTGGDERWEKRWLAIKALPQPPGSTTADYHWVVKQKKRKARGVLEPDRIARCEEIAWWSWK